MKARTIRELKKTLPYRSLSLRFFSSSVDNKEKQFFNQFGDWWDLSGSMRMLHVFNRGRMDYISRMSRVYLRRPTVANHAILEGHRVLDVGCGGGILSESMARLGGEVTGLDISSTAITAAKGHLEHVSSELKDKVNYYEMPVEDLAADKPPLYDVVCASEIIEHVVDPGEFINSLSLLTKPGGILFISTLNRTLASYTVNIIGAEKITGFVPDGTHDWNKFITPEEMRTYLSTADFTLKDIQGLQYNPVVDRVEMVPWDQLNYFTTSIRS
mmetsp:Transcript_1247/g.1313  ORF Transcript_1247/g.1313 Transcript_1247/m.1313 type:complete len:271 (-) Transcript_1247:89-901(-)